MFRTTSSLLEYYEALGFKKGSNPSPKDVKVAYFKVARQYHPDAVRNLGAAEQKAATRKFQEAANAYETLSDPNKKAAYDRTQTTSSWGGEGWGQQKQGSGQSSNANANKTWGNVSNDADVIEEAIREYAAEMQEDAEKAIDGIRAGNFDEAWTFLRNHKGVVASVVLPTFLIFRFPGPVMAALRFLPQILVAALAFSVRVGGSAGLQSLWRLLGGAAAFGSKVNGKYICVMSQNAIPEYISCNFQAP